MHSMSQPTLSPDTPALHRTYFPECDKLKDCPASCGIFVSLLYLHPKIPCTHALSLILPVLPAGLLFPVGTPELFHKFLIIFLIKQIRYICQESFTFSISRIPLFFAGFYIFIRIFHYITPVKICKEYPTDFIGYSFPVFIPC